MTQPSDLVETFRNIPAPQLTLVQPRMLSAYGALLIAATLGVLYLYRGRAFIVYWIGAWLFIAGALALVSQAYDDTRLGGVILGLAVLLIVWAAGLVLLAARAFPENPLRWDWPVKIAALSAVWFLAGSFVLPGASLIATGVVATITLLTLAAVHYFQLARARTYAGAFILAAGLALVGVVNLGGAAAMFGLIATDIFTRLAIINVVSSIFVALGMQLLVFEDMTDELRRANRDSAGANDAVRRLAITDSLTGCYNRRFFDEIQRREVQRHRRYNSPLSVVFVDVDRFKSLNDTQGHEAGDELLRSIGTLLREHVRESDYVLRWGGDEFLLLLTCTLEQAQRKSAELKLAFRDELRDASGSPDIGLSIGAAQVSPDADNLTDTISEADSRMYDDKLRTREAARRTD